MEVKYSLKKSLLPTGILMLVSLLFCIGSVIYTFYTYRLILLIPDILLFILFVYALVFHFYSNKEIIIKDSLLTKKIYGKDHVFSLKDVDYVKTYGPLEKGCKKCVVVFKDNSGILIQPGYMTNEQVETFKKILDMNNIEMRIIDKKTKKEVLGDSKKNEK